MRVECISVLEDSTLQDIGVLVTISTSVVCDKSLDSFYANFYVTIGMRICHRREAMVDRYSWRNWHVAAVVNSGSPLDVQSCWASCSKLV